MKLRYAIALAMMPFAASASTISSITISGDDLLNASTIAGDNRTYAIDLNDLGFREVTSITVVDDANNANNVGGRRSGFDLDLLAIGTDLDSSLFSGDTIDFRPGGVRSNEELFGAIGNGNGDDVVLNEAFATLDALDASSGPNTGFVSLGRQGELTSSFSRSFFVFDGDFLFVSGFNGRGNPVNEISPADFDELGSITIEGVVVPLPASSLLLLGGLASLFAARRRTSSKKS